MILDHAHPLGMSSAKALPLSKDAHDDLVRLIADVTHIDPSKIEVRATFVPNGNGTDTLRLSVVADGRPLSTEEQEQVRTILLHHFSARDDEDPSDVINCTVPYAMN